jgi:hypothetical protein
MLPVCVSVAMTRATGSQFVALENGESLPRTANPMLPQSKWQPTNFCWLGLVIIQNVLA